MANPNPQNKFQKGNKVAGRKPGQLCLAFEQRRGDKRSAIFGAWFSAGIAVGEWATARGRDLGYLWFTWVTHWTPPIYAQVHPK